MWKRMINMGSIAQKLLLLGIIISIVPVLGMGMIVYIAVEQGLTEEIESTNRNTMNQMRERIEGTMSQVDRMIVQSMYSHQLNLELYRADGFDWRALNDITMMLASLEELIEYAEEISIYVTGSEQRITAEGLFDEGTRVMDAYLDQGRWRSESPFMWYERIAEPSSGNKLAGLTLVRKIPIAAEEPYGYFIVHLHEDVFADIFDQMRIGKTGGMLLLTPSGNRYAEPALDELLGQEEYGPVADAWLAGRGNVANGETLKSSGGRKLFVQTIEAKQNGWKYAAIVPYHEITAPLHTILRILWTTCAIIILIVLFFIVKLYFRAAGRLNTLLGRMKYKVPSAMKDNRKSDELGQLEHYMDQMHGIHERMEDKLLSSFPDLKAHYLRKWLTEPLSEPLLDHLKTYELYQDDRNYVSFCIEWDTAVLLDPSAAASMQIEDIIITLGAIDLSPVRSFLVRLDDDRVGGVLEFEQPPLEMGLKSRVEQCLRAYVRAADQQLNQSIVIGAGDTALEADQISVNFQQALEALRHRLVDSHKTLFFADEAGCYPEAFRYPVQQEQSMISAIYRGDPDQAYLALDDFADTLSNNNELSGEQLLHAYSLLLSALLRTGNSSGNGFTVDQRLFRANLFEQLNRLRTVEHIHHWLREDVIAQIAEQTHYQRSLTSSKDTEIIQQAITYIHDHADQEISLKKVAELVGLREVQFSLMFKQESGLSYTDYIINHRVERAKALLVQTNLKIAEIAQRMSYGNSQNFIRLFKQKVGMTPGEYRKSSRNTK